MSKDVVRTSHGMVRGKRVIYGNLLKCQCFLGIPYAKAPIGSLRFQAPQPLEPWLDVLDATQFQNDCLQLDDITREPFGSEDCLYLNIFTPDIESKTNLPVLISVNVWGFHHGSAKTSFYHPQYLLAEGLIVVTFSFRLGPLGFLSACEPRAPGNAGLKDVLSVLRWIKTNISQFGGDPNNITLAGSSGGSVIVNYLMFSKAAKGLFQKAIAQSGTFTNPWAFAPDPLKTTCLMANVLGCKSTEPSEIVDFLKNVPAVSLITAINEMQKRNKDQFFMIPFCPCRETELEGQEAFLTKTPKQLIKSNEFMDIPYLTGFNRDEGFLFLVWEKFIKNDEISESLETFAAWTLNLDYRSFASAEIAKKVSSFYFNGSSTPDEYRKKFTEVLTDFAIVESLNRFVKATAAKKRISPYFYYMFDYFGPHTVISKALRNEMKVVSHQDELAYLFDCCWKDKSEDTDDSILVRKKMISMWSNFIKTGNPTPCKDDILTIKWEPVTDPRELNYLKIGRELSMEKNPFEQRMKFWESICDDVKASRGQKFISKGTNLGNIII